MAPPRAPSALAVLAAHGLLLWGLLQGVSTPGSAPTTQAAIAWLTLQRPAAEVVAPAPAVRPAAAARAAARADVPPRPAEAAVPEPPDAPARPAAAPEALARPSAPETTPPPAPPAAATAVAATLAPTTPPPAAPAPPAPPSTFTRPDHAHCVAPPHPPALRERGIEGVVRLRVQVDARGQAAAVELKASSGWRLFDEAALAQVRGCHFQPARRDGVAVDSWVEFPMRFALVNS